MKITIAICTWNRCQSLHNTLSSVQSLRVPPDLDWELLVVNNNCTDDTDRVLADFTATLPLRALKETRQGLAHARNHAIEAARGDYLIWTDDDVILDSGWLNAYFNAFTTWPGSAIFGGPILPIFEGEPPPWLKDAMRDGVVNDVYALRYFGNEPILLDANNGKIPYGSNLAVRMEEQKKFRFDLRFGLTKNDNIRDDETDILGKILGSGFTGRWVPGAYVRHVIPKHRQTVSYIRDYYVGKGRGYARRWPEQSTSLLLAAPKWRWRLGAALTVKTRYLLKRTISPPYIWCKELEEESFLWGKHLEYRAIRRGT